MYYVCGLFAANVLCLLFLHVYGGPSIIPILPRPFPIGHDQPLCHFLMSLDVCWALSAFPPTLHVSGGLYIFLTTDASSHVVSSLSATPSVG